MFGLSALGSVHTFISLLAVVAALVMFGRYGRIVPRGVFGSIYLVCTVIGCLTALGLSKHGGFNPGHALAIITLLCLVGAIVVERIDFKVWPYVQVTLLSTSLFFSLIPAVNETLTRLPLSHPFATGPTDPLVQKSLGILALLFLLTLAAQLIYLRKSRTQV